MTQPSITCPECGMTSYNPNDIREKYCGNCHWWTSDPQLGPHFAEVKGKADELAAHMQSTPRDVRETLASMFRAFRP